MIIKTKLSEKDFINVSFVLFYSKIAVKIYTRMLLALGFFMLMSSVLMSTDSITSLAGPILGVSILPLFIYYNAKKTYELNPTTRELIEYHFDKNQLTLKGETFTKELEVKKLYKVNSKNRWILIWPNNQYAHPIPKNAFSYQQLQDLKNLLNECGVKNNLE